MGEAESGGFSHIASTNEQACRRLVGRAVWALSRHVGEQVKAHCGLAEDQELESSRMCKALKAGAFVSQSHACSCHVSVLASKG